MVEIKHSDEQRNKINRRVVSPRRGSCPVSRAVSASPWPAVSNRSLLFVPPLRTRTPRESHTRRTSVRSSVPTVSCVATPPTTCQQPCSLLGREYNMTDGHSRTTVGHRTVRGQEPPLLCVRACVSTCLRACVRACVPARLLARSPARLRASRVVRIAGGRKKETEKDR